MTLEIITGPMFSGKSTELIRTVKREGYAKKKIGLFKPDIDKRYGGEDKVVTHDGLSFATFAMPTSDEGVIQIYDIVKQNNMEVVGIDEIEFFPDSVIELCKRLADEKIKVIITGLNLNFRGEPFSVLAHLLPFADNIRHLSAVCAVCGQPATRTQRLIDGQPAHYDSPLILVGGQDFYEARCREHHEVRR